MAGVKRIVQVEAGQNGEDVGLQRRHQKFERRQRHRRGERQDRSEDADEPGRAEEPKRHGAQ